MNTVQINRIWQWVPIFLKPTNLKPTNTPNDPVSRFQKFYCKLVRWTVERFDENKYFVDSGFWEVDFEKQSILWLKNQDGWNRYELLARFWNEKSIIKVLETLRSRWETFELFVKVIIEAFKIIEETSHAISINLYVQDIINDDFMKLVMYLSTKYHINNKLLTFEILENDKLSDYPNVLEKITTLKEHWFKISIDDVNFEIDSKDNHSYDNLMYLVNNWIIPDEVKFDWKFIQELYKNREKSEVKQKIYEIQQVISYLKNKWVESFVWEWISDNDLGKFVKDNLGCNLFQWKYLNPETFNLY